MICVSRPVLDLDRGAGAVSNSIAEYLAFA